MIQARKNPTNGRYVLYVGDSRGLSYYVAGAAGVVNLYSRPTREFNEVYAENHPVHLQQVVRALAEDLPEGWRITPSASMQLRWAATVIRKNPRSSGEITMADKKTQPKLAAGEKPTSKPAKPGKAAAEEKPVKPSSKPAKPVAAQPAAEEGEVGGGRRCPYAGQQIKVLSTEVAAREGTLRHAILTEIVQGGTVDEILGVEIESDDGKSGKVNTAWLSFAKNAGLVEFVD